MRFTVTYLSMMWCLKAPAMCSTAAAIMTLPHRANAARQKGQRRSARLARLATCLQTEARSGGNSRRRMADAARKRDQHQREIEQPMRDICQECLGFAVLGQARGVRLGRGVGDTCDCDDENRDAERFMQRKQ